MKISTEELLLAAVVRDRVTELRNVRAKKIPDEELEAFLAQPVGDLVKEALTELNGIARLISQHRENT